MGDQESKIDYRNGIKPQLPSILSRKLEAMKRRWSNSSLSKQMLLKDGSEDDSGSSNDRKSSVVSSQEADDDSLAGYAKVAPIEPIVSDNGIDKEALAMEKLTLGGKKDRPVSLVCSGSPSFRLYLTQSEKQGGKEELTVKEIVESQTSTDKAFSN